MVPTVSTTLNERSRVSVIDRHPDHATNEVGARPATTGREQHRRRRKLKVMHDRENEPMLGSMHVLVATAGALSPTLVVEFARHLIGGTGSVTIATVVEVPRSFLEEINQGDWHPLRDTNAATPDDTVVTQYLEERAHRLTEPLRLALERARIPCELLVLEGEDAAAAISSAASELQADVVILGATKQIFDRDAWESVSSRVMLESGKAVLVVPEARKDPDDVENVEDLAQIVESSIVT